MNLVLSLFPGIDLFGQAFEAEGFCVVRGPDVLWGGDIRRFHPPARKFVGVIGGSPCQDFSRARRGRPPTGYSSEMIDEFMRVVYEADPEWWLLENVSSVPDVKLDGWSWQRIDVNQAWYCPVNRNRHFQFGSRVGKPLDIPRGPPVRGAEPAALACDSRSLSEVCRMQGLPEDFDLPPFTAAAKIAAVGNGVPLVLGRVVARAVIAAHARERVKNTYEPTPAVPRRACDCGCGRPVPRAAKYYGATCRKRAERRRRKANDA